MERKGSEAGPGRGCGRGADGGWKGGGSGGPFDPEGGSCSQLLSAYIVFSFCVFPTHQFYFIVTLIVWDIVAAVAITISVICRLII